MNGNIIENESLHDLMELPWKTSFILMMRAKSIKNIFERYKDEFSPFLQQNYSKIEGLTLLDPFRLDNNLFLLERAVKIEGDIVECGCFKGGNALLMAMWLKSNNIRKKIILFDSFEGLPEPDASNDSGYKAGQFTASFDELNKQIDQLELKDYFVLQKGWFKDTIKPFLTKNPNLKIAFMHIDCDLYESTMDSFPDLFRHLNQKGIALFDDFNDGGKGEKIAVLKTLQKDFTISIGPAPQAYIINEHSAENGIKDWGFFYNFDELVKNSAYLKWLNDVCKLPYAEMLQKAMKKQDD